ncbi:MAG: HEAT repeat domain-containing protein [Oligoflexia bacterium]|nr:HEAT repeat domain-containing protein [Oligoflexia bacterium]
MSSEDGGTSNEVQVQTVQDRVQEPDLMSIDDIKAHRKDIAARMVSDPDPAVRAELAAALGYTAHDAESIPAFAAALHTEHDTSVQRRLVAVLVSFSRPDATGAVVDFALEQVDSPLWPDLVTALAGSDPAMVLSALGASSSPSGARLRRELCRTLPGSAYCAS